MKTSFFISLFSILGPATVNAVNLGLKTWDCTDTPQSCNNACFAIFCQGKPTTLTYNGGGKANKKFTRANRVASGAAAVPCQDPAGRGINRQNALDLIADEYPFASAQEGGAGAVIRCTDADDSNAQATQVRVNIWGCKAQRGDTATIQFSNFGNSPFCANNIGAATPSCTSDTFEFERTSGFNQRPLTYGNLRRDSGEFLEDDEENWSFSTFTDHKEVPQYKRFLNSTATSNAPPPPPVTTSSPQTSNGGATIVVSTISGSIVSETFAPTTISQFAGLQSTITTSTTTTSSGTPVVVPIIIGPGGVAWNPVGLPPIIPIPPPIIPPPFVPPPIIPPGGGNPPGGGDGNPTPSPTITETISTTQVTTSSGPSSTLNDADLEDDELPSACEVSPVLTGSSGFITSTGTPSPPPIISSSALPPPPVISSSLAAPPVVTSILSTLPLPPITIPFPPTITTFAITTTISECAFQTVTHGCVRCIVPCGNVNGNCQSISGCTTASFTTIAPIAIY